MCGFFRWGAKQELVLEGSKVCDTKTLGCCARQSVFLSEAAEKGFRLVPQSISVLGEMTPWMHQERKRE